MAHVNGEVALRRIWTVEDQVAQEERKPHAAALKRGTGFLANRAVGSVAANHPPHAKFLEVAVGVAE